jgi:predicted nucleotide-binding protein
METFVKPSPPSSILEQLRGIYKRGLTVLKSERLSKGNMDFWLSGLKSKLQEIYGATTPIAEIYREKVAILRKNGITEEQFALEVTNLKGLIDQFEYSAGLGVLNPVSTPSVPPSGKNVFVIHGHDELNTHRLTLLLQNHFQVNPIVIISKPGMSRPLIDKYEDSASMCCFAFALVTPDDTISSSPGIYCQARPNVIFELGWFVGRLGKHRVTILLKEGTTIHSDIDGVSRIQFRDNVEDKYLDIQRELEAAGMIEKTGGTTPIF